MRDRLDAVLDALDDLRGSAKRVAKALFPPDLFAYIPGQKLIAGAVVYVAVSLIGLDSNQVFSLPGVGEVTLEDVAAFVAVYFWPTNKPVADPS